MLIIVMYVKVQCVIIYRFYNNIVARMCSNVQYTQIIIVCRMLSYQYYVYYPALECSTEMCCHHQKQSSSGNIRLHVIQSRPFRAFLCIDIHLVIRHIEETLEGIYIRHSSLIPSISLCFILPGNVSHHNSERGSVVCRNCLVASEVIIYA